MTPFKNLYGRRCRSLIGLSKVCESALLDPEIVYNATEKICMLRVMLKQANSKQISYVDNRSRELDFEVGDWIYLNTSPMKGVMRFGINGKLSLRYVALM